MRLIKAYNMGSKSFKKFSDAIKEENRVWNLIMFDGSHYSIDENVAKTTELVALAHDHGLSIEAEVGSIGGEEQAVFKATQRLKL